MSVHGALAPPRPQLRHEASGVAHISIAKLSRGRGIAPCRSAPFITRGVMQGAHTKQLALVSGRLPGVTGGA